MTELKVQILNNKNATDEVLAIIAKEAKEANDEETLMKLATHPGAGQKTLSIIAI